MAERGLNIPEVWIMPHKKEDKNMAETKALRTVKLRLKGIERGPIEMTIAPKKKIILDENGVAEVEEGLARKLLSPEYAGAGWELYKEEPPAKGRKSKGVEEEPSKEEFAQQI